MRKWRVLAGFRDKAPSFLTFDFLDHLARNICLRAIYPCFKELINNSRKYIWWFLFFSQTTKTCQETLFDWLIIQCLVWVTKQDFIVHLQSHSLEVSWSPTTRGQNFKKVPLASDLFHGYKDLARQSSWWSILFRVYVYIHWSKAVALFAQFLSSLLERNSTNKRRPWQNYMPRVQKTVSDFWKWKSQRTSHQFSNKQPARCLGNKRV